jgi:hypothetical protein
LSITQESWPAKIDTKTNGPLYLRKKAFLFGVQVKSRCGAEGWTCTEAQPQASEQPVGGVLLRENCSKTRLGRAIVVQGQVTGLRLPLDEEDDERWATAFPAQAGRPHCRALSYIRCQVTFPGVKSKRPQQNAGLHLRVTAPALLRQIPDAVPASAARPE